MQVRPKAVTGGAARRYITTYHLRREPGPLNAQPADTRSLVYTIGVKTLSPQKGIFDHPSIHFLFRVGRGDDVGLGHDGSTDLICTFGTAETEVTQVLPGQTPWC